MLNEQMEEAEALFQIAADLAPDEREPFLSERCGADSALRTLVDRLLRHHDGGMSRFLEPPANPGRFEAGGLPSRPARIGPYEILYKIGEGGMAIVFAAQQFNPHRTVALKVIKGWLGDTALIRRFRFEVRILAKLSHPGVTRVYEAGETPDGIPYYTMELVDGLPLTHYAGTRHLDIAARLELMARVCDAVHHAHVNGIIHRDLKPANILVTEVAGSEPQPKVLDFGVARALRADLQTLPQHTLTGQLVGTLAYMSPEQITGDPDKLDARSDVYQLGVTLYELLVGRRPFDVTELGVPQASRMILEQDPPRLRSIDTRFRGDVEAIAEKAMSKDRKRRYASAAALGDDIRRSLRGDPITARPSSGLYRLRRLARRRREALLGLAGGLVITVAAALWLSGRTAAERRDQPAPPTATQLTFEPRGIPIWSAAISPDGSMLAIFNDQGVLVQDIASKEIAPLKLPPGCKLAADALRWDPRGPAIVLALDVDGSLGWYRVSTDGAIAPALSPAAVTAMGGMPSDVRPSPDGGRLLCVTQDAQELWIVADETGSAVRLHHAAENTTIGSAVWSPTGEAIAYIALGRTNALIAVDLAGNVTAVSGPTSGLVQEYAVGSTQDLLWWLPDGRLLYSQAMDDPHALSSVIRFRQLDAVSGVPRGESGIVMGWVGFGIGSLSASTAGDRLAFLKKETQDDIFWVDLDADGRFDGTPERLTFDRGLDRFAVWSRDGTRIFFESDRFGSRDVLSQRPGDPTPQKLVASPTDERPLCLAPGGDYLLVSRQSTTPGQPADLLRVPVAGGPAETIAQLERGQWIACGAGTGAPCVLARRSGQDVVFEALDESWQPQDEVGRAHVGDRRYDWALSASGQQLALVTIDGTVGILDLVTHQWHDVPTQPRRLQYVAISPDGQNLYVSQLGPPAIVRIARDGGSEVLWQSERDWLWAPCVSPDGKRLVLGVREHGEDVWMLTGF